MTQTPMAFFKAPPETRIWALVLRNGTNVPFVGQYEPKLDQWLGPGGSRHQPWECQWTYLPYHERFDPLTCAVDTARKSVVDELTQEAEDLGLYDKG